MSAKVKKEKKYQQLNVYLDKGEYEKLKAKAHRECRSMLATIRMLVNRYVEEKE